VQLLVSVSNPTEARRAVDGGADVIDAKDPLNGALGAVSLDTLRQIHSVVAGRRVVTAALGDASDERAIERLAFEYARVGIGFVKIGFAGITDRSCVDRLLTLAVRGARAAGQADCGVVAVAYADTDSDTSVERIALVDIAARTGATGVLLDTADKNGPSLPHVVSAASLEAWVGMAHDAGLTVALAGRLTADDLSFIRDTGADIVGVRGAVCEGARSSHVVEQKVRDLKAHLCHATVI
jgi:(5-formylfuran-3-yl)methyl phosphate synthase